MCTLNLRQALLPTDLQGLYSTSVTVKILQCAYLKLGKCVPQPFVLVLAAKSLSGDMAGSDNHATMQSSNLLTR